MLGDPLGDGDPLGGDPLGADDPDVDGCVAVGPKAVVDVVGLLRLQAIATTTMTSAAMPAIQPQANPRSGSR